MKNTAIPHVQNIQSLLHDTVVDFCQFSEASIGPAEATLSLTTICDAHLMMGNWKEFNHAIQ